MLIGVDFDNTIVSYDALFHRIAMERGLVPPDLPVNKTAVRDHLRAAGREDVWTAMQGEVYGTRLAEAAPFPGVLDFFRACRERGLPVVIVSHKTRHPFLGPKHDLHAAARAWLTAQGFFDPAGAGLRPEAAFFELTKADKLARIGAAGCTHFIDDLPELLADAAFPAHVARFLFDPAAQHVATQGVRTAHRWADLHASLLEDEPWLVAAAEILASASLAASGPPIALSGGANNRVFRLPVVDGTSVIAKRYFRREGDPRNRFATERSFYRYAEATGVKQIPTALGWNEAEELGLFTRLPGERLTTVESSHLDQALDFLTALNDGRFLPEANALPVASEACFAVDAHLTAVRQRLGALVELRADDEIGHEAKGFVRDALQPAWEAIEQDVLQWRAPRRLAFTLPRSERCISPSDFGFHNSLLAPDGRLAFFDFEYAGWDDPAKLVCDFFCQPELPAPREDFDRFVTTLAERLELPDTAEFATRCHLLLPVYQVKWACILLNEFTPTGRRRREFSLGLAAASARRGRQLARARAMIGRPRLVAA